MQEHQYNFEYAMSLDIDFMSNMDFIDIKSVYQSNKNLSLLEINKILKLILINKNINLHYLPIQFSVFDAVNEIYQKLNSLVSINYPYNYLPSWVNKEQFITSQVQKMIPSVIVEVYFYIRENIKDDGIKFTLDYPTSLNIDINKIVIANPLLPVNIKVRDIETDSYNNVFNTITLSQNVINYIFPPILKLYNDNPTYRKNRILYRWPIFQLLEKLLFKMY